MFEGSIEDRAEQAEKLLTQLAPNAICVAQEWDDRIDCLLKLADGRVIGEAILLSRLTEQRIREAGERLRLRGEGVDVPLVDEILPSVRISLSPRS